MKKYYCVYLYIMNIFCNYLTSLYFLHFLNLFTMIFFKIIEQKLFLKIVYKLYGVIVAKSETKSIIGFYLKTELQKNNNCKC